MNSKHFSQCASDCRADERGLIVAASDDMQDEPYEDFKWFAFFLHDTVNKAIDEAEYTGASFEVIAEADTHAELERLVFWLEIRSELAVVGAQIDDAGPWSLRTGNTPCGLYFFPDGEIASERAYSELLNDIAPQRLVRFVSSIVTPGPVFRRYEDATERML